MLALRSVIGTILVVAALDACTTHRDDNRSATPGVTRAPFGRLPDGRAVELFTLTNAHGVEVRAITYGGIITVIRTPDRNGQLDDIVLGFDSLAGYLGDSPYFGAIVGRYANRIARGQFTLDGVTYQLARNNGANSLHGGMRGFDKVLWAGEPLSGDSVGVRFRYTSRDGDEGYPGSVAVSVTYTLTPRDELVVDYEASTDKATPINLSQHTYWNLHGAGRGNPPDRSSAPTFVRRRGGIQKPRRSLTSPLDRNSQILLRQKHMEEYSPADKER